jgi:hypothetical protein
VNQPLSGPGLGLPLPTNLYPSEISFGAQNAPYDFATNQITLAPGQNLPIPAGDWQISMGGYLVFQYKDPVTGLWTFSSGSAYSRGLNHLTSDGYNLRIANLTNCPVAAFIASQGASYVQSTTTVTATGGNSTWQPIVGGALAFTGGSVASTGGGYGIAPLLIIPDPPNAANNVNGVGGIPASGYVGLGTGTVVLTGVTFTNQGAGYPSAPANVALLPVPTDPNLSSGITLATCAFSLTNSGLITACLCTNSGAPLSSPTAITLAVAGAGVTATVSAVVMQTITAASVSGQGIGYGTGATPVFAVGGVPSQGTISSSPNSKYLSWFPRPVDISITGANTSVSTGTAGVVYDGGLFLSAPTAAWPAAVGAATTVGTVAFTMGGAPDIAYIQPAP